MVWGLQTDGSWLRKPLANIVADLKLEAQAQEGADVNLAPTAPLTRFINVVALEMSYQEQRIEEAYYSGFKDTATGDSLDNVGSTYYGLPRTGAEKSTTTVTFSRATAPGSPVTIPSGTVVQTAAGIQFKTTAAGTITSPATSVNVAVEALIAGVSGNVAGGTITQFATPVSGVETVTNASAATGGVNKEADDAFRARLDASGAGLGKATRAAVRAAVRAVAGVTQALVIENATPTGSEDDTLLDRTDTDTAITIDGTTTRIAQRFVPSRRSYLQHVYLRMETNSALVATVSIQTDSAGSPSGNVVGNLSKSWTPAGTTAEKVTFPAGEFLSSGTTYWVVIERTSGSGTLEAATTGTADQVKQYAGSWADATPNNLYCQVKGGLPPGSFRVVLSGTPTANAVAQALLDTRGLADASDGNLTGTAVDDAGQNVTERYDLATEKLVYVSVTATGGSATAIENAIIKYIGGTDNNSTPQPGLGVGDDVLFAKLVSVIMAVSGVTNATVTLGFSASPSGTADLSIGPTEVARASLASVIINGA